MSESCGHNCSSCSQDCASRDMHEKPNASSHIKKVIGVVSGKGGVGKSLVTSMLAVLSARNGHSTAILDADITGPSIPKVFGVHGKAVADESGIIPSQSRAGIGMMSVNLMLDHEDDPVIWRGPVIASVVKQFWTEVSWGDVDYLFVDMPPGTGDVALTLFQTIPVDGLIIVTSPQELVSMIVGKAVKMAKMMNIPILGIVENLSYVECPDCGRHINVFGESHVDETAAEYGLEVLAKMPIAPQIAGLCDAGLIETFQGDWLDGALKKIES